MDIPNNSWALVATSPTSLRMQNVGVSRIAYVFAAAQPGAGDITLDSDGHFIMAPGAAPYEYNGAAMGKNVYARSLGSRNGKLALDKTP